MSEGSPMSAWQKLRASQRQEETNTVYKNEFNNADAYLNSIDINNRRNATNEPVNREIRPRRNFGNFQLEEPDVIAKYANKGDPNLSVDNILKDLRGVKLSGYDEESEEHESTSPQFEKNELSKWFQSIVNRKNENTISTSNTENEKQTKRLVPKLDLAPVTMKRAAKDSNHRVVQSSRTYRNAYDRNESPEEARPITIKTRSLSARAASTSASSKSSARLSSRKPTEEAKISSRSTPTSRDFQLNGSKLSAQTEKRDIVSKQESEFLRQQSLGVVRLRAKIDLKYLRLGFRSLQLYRERHKSTADPRAISRFSTMRAIRLLHKMFHNWRYAANYKANLRIRFMKRRFLTRWHNQCKLIFLFRVMSRINRQKRFLLIWHDATRERHQAKRAIHFYRFRLVSRTLRAWKSFVSILLYSKQQLRREQNRQDKINAYLSRISTTHEHSQRKTKEERSASETQRITSRLSTTHRSHSSQDNTLPDPTPKPPRKPTPMELRAMERTERRKALDERYAKIAEEKELERLRMESELERLKLEEKDRLLAERRVKEQEILEKRKQNEEQNRIATTHRVHSLLWFYGMRPWVLFVKREARRMVSAAKFHDFQIVKFSFGKWQQRIEDIHQARIRKHHAMHRASENFRRRSLLQLGWRSWRQLHMDVVERFLEVRYRQKQMFIRSALHRWVQRLHKEIARQDSYGEIYLENLERRTLRAWHTATIELQSNRRAEQAKERMWSKVRNWLDE